jgi:hypothetical protein
MIEDADVEERKRLLETARDELVGLARFSGSAVQRRRTGDYLGQDCPAGGGEDKGGSCGRMEHRLDPGIMSCVLASALPTKSTRYQRRTLSDNALHTVSTTLGSILPHKHLASEMVIGLPQQHIR